MQTPEEREAQEKDSFIKTAVLAFVANYWAHNTQIELEQIVAKGLQLAELTWQQVVEYRKRNAQ